MNLIMNAQRLYSQQITRSHLDWIAQRILTLKFVTLATCLDHGSISLKLNAIIWRFECPRLNAKHQRFQFPFSKYNFWCLKPQKADKIGILNAKK